MPIPTPLKIRGALVDHAYRVVFTGSVHPANRRSDITTTLPSTDSV
jgi:hypothetical protein